MQKSVRVKLLATVQPETIERSLDGRITYASRAFLALYDPLAWPNDELGLMYTDSQVPQQINLFLRQEHGSSTRSVGANKARNRAMPPTSTPTPR